MAVTGTPVVAAAANTITATEMREFLRDYAVQNPLLDTVEFSDTEFTTAIDRAVDHANVISRATTWAAANFPNKYALLIGAAQYILQSEAFRQVRNQATYQDGNIQPIGIDDKQAAYLGMSQALKQEYIQLVTSIKIAENMSVRGSLASPVGNRWWR
ncbi:hypothetical protein CMI47_20050 [Candidatus Pacearchaeota archaeon]|nr:hypothetical protein [Candidatus Pacearchaeota archaeon]|tara:strand:- start:275 stop:745 length:471 start_codon:yes stop_codon:yes gene_type:complete